jgi:hypothetical protein
MAARKRAGQKPTSSKKPKKGASFRAVADGLYELHLGARVVLDLLVTLDGELMTFVRVDGEILAELPIAGQA